MAASEAKSLATYANPRAPDLWKQCAGMASRICLMVKSGSWNSLPYVSSIFPLPSLVSSAPSEPREDSEVEDGDCLGVSTGEADTELEDDEGAESATADRCRTLFREAAVADMTTKRKAPRVVTGCSGLFKVQCRYR